MFLKNCWYVAAWDHELIDGKLLPRTMLEKRVLLYKGESGKVVALRTAAAIAARQLSLGRHGRRLRSLHVPRPEVRSHGQVHPDPRPGQHSRQAGRAQLPRGRARPPGVDLDGRAGQADPATILDFPYLRDPQWKGIPDYLHYDANYLLIVDNLSDFAHLAFVHTKTLGGSEEYAYVTKPVVMERLERGFRVERWHMDARAAAVPQKVITAKDKVDRRNIGHMHIPGNFFMETLFSPAGSGAEKGNLEGAKHTATASSMTPETRKTTHHFWIYLNNFEGGDRTISRSLHASLIEVSWRTSTSSKPSKSDGRGPGLQAPRRCRRCAAGAFPPDAGPADCQGAGRHLAQKRLRRLIRA